MWLMSLRDHYCQCQVFLYTQSLMASSHTLTICKLIHTLVGKYINYHNTQTSMESHYPNVNRCSYILQTPIFSQHRFANSNPYFNCCSYLSLTHTHTHTHIHTRTHTHTFFSIGLTQFLRKLKYIYLYCSLQNNKLYNKPTNLVPLYCALLNKLQTNDSYSIFKVKLQVEQ